MIDFKLYKLKDIKGLGPGSEDIVEEGIIRKYQKYLQMISPLTKEEYYLVITNKPIEYDENPEFLFNKKFIKNYNDASLIFAFIKINYPNIKESLEKGEEIIKNQDNPPKKKKSLISRFLN